MLAKLLKFVKAVTPPLALPAVLKVLTYVRYLSYRSARSEEFAKNAGISKVADADTACLFATGPSLKQLDLKRLHNVDCYSVSNFFLHEDTARLNLKLHFFAPFHPPLVESEYVSWLEASDKQLPSDTGIVLGHQTRAIVEAQHLFRDREVFYLSLEKSQLSRLPDLTKTVLSPHTGPLMILPVLLYMGYKRIVLFGCDHDVLKSYGGTVKNFYDAKKDIRSNATAGDRWSNGIVWHLQHTAETFLQYQFYADAARRMDVEIINCSPNSWLDCYKKTNYDSVLELIN